MKKKKIKLISLFASFMLFLAIFINYNENTVYARDEYHNAYDYYQTYGGDSCRFAVVDGIPRIYFNAYGSKGSTSSVRYRTIGWKANLYLNGGYQESVYFSLNGSYIFNVSNTESNGVEYNLYYIRLNDLVKRFSNQAAIKSGTGEIKLDAIMSIVPAKSNSPKGSCDDYGNYYGEVYDTYSGISNARGWAHKEDLKSRFNKVPTGMYRNVTVTGGTGIASTSGSGKYIYGTIATISATCSTGYDFDKWSDGKTSSRFYITVTSDLTYSCSGKLKIYTVSYDANGGIGAPGNQIKTYGYILTLSSQKPTKTGYLFNYWDGSDGKTYKPGAVFSTNADTKMTAHWTPITYYVSYNKNKPDKASHDVSGIMTNSTHSYNNEIKSAGYTPNLSKNGYSIKGWSFRYWDSQANDKGTDYSNGSYIKNLTSTNGATVNMYAQWKPNVYMLILDDQYATSDGTPYIYEKFDYGWYSNKIYGSDFAGKYADGSGSISNVIIPKKTGMKFNGYFSEKNGKGTKYIDENGNIVASNNAFANDSKYVYAYWTPNIYDITLDNQGATKSGTTHIYEKYSVGFYSNSEATSTFSNGKIDIPQKDNYIFDGYWTEQNNYKTSHGEEIINADGTINDVNTKFAANSTIFAKWVPKDYKIKLDNQGADIDKGTAAFYEKYNEFNYTTMGDYDVNTGIATIRYDYTGNVQYFIAPADGEYTLNVAGAQGGDLKSGKGGYGGESTGKVKLKKGDSLRIYVGNKPTGYNSSFNGSSGWAVHDIIGGSCVAGGGATDIRKNGDSLEDRIIVAGAGGGATEYGWDPYNVAVDGGTGGKDPSNVKYICQFGSHVKEIGTTNTKGATQSKSYNYTTPEKYRSYYKFHESDLTGVEKHPYVYIGNENSGSGWGFISIIYNAKDYNLGYNNGGGGYYGGGFMHGNCIISGGLGGSSYIGGVTDGAMTTGTNSGNGYATISYNAKELCQYSVVEKYFNYTGSGQTFTAPADGEYLLEVAGAQGCGENDTDGGKGGYSSGKVKLKNGWAKITYTDTTLDGSSVCSIRTPQKTGYTFGGYYTQPNGQGDLVVNEDGMVTTTPTYFHEENRNGTEKANVNSKGETTVYAKWTNNQYSFHYIGNGGKTSTGGETISDGVSYNTPYHVRATNNTFYRTGYKLTGWREKNTDGTWGREWPADTNVTYLETHSTTVFAQWEALDVNYTVNYYKEDLDGNYQYVTKETKSAKTDSVEKVIPTTNKTLFDNTGFTLNKDKSCTGSNQIPESVDDGIISVKIKGDGSTVVNYYYSRNSYKLTLKIANGDKGFKKLIGAGDTNINNTWTQDKMYGQEVAIGVELNDDYEFVDWEYENKTVASKEASYKFTMPCNDVTLYAHSNSKPGSNPKVFYTVTVKHYFQNGETSYKEDTSKRVTDTVEENTLYTPKTTMIPSGYSYSKMVNSATGENAANGFIVTKNTTVDVYYDRLQYKIVTERYVDGVLYDTFAENAYYNEQYTVKGLDLKKCNLTGYKLDKIDVPGFGNVNSFTVTGNITKENPIKVYYIPRTFTVTFDANRGAVTDSNEQVTKTTRKVKYNYTDNNDVSSLNPVKTGYTFIGWYTEKEGGSQIYNEKGKCNNDETYWKDNKWCAESDLTVYAHWKANIYNLTFDANGGLVNTDETTAICTPTYDKPFFNDVEYLNPVKTGYTFIGWYTEKEGGSQIYNNKGKCTNDGTYWKNGNWHYVGNATVYAHWKANTYTVKYVPNGGTGTMPTDTATYDSNYTTRENGFTREGYKFVGWNEKYDGTGTDWTARIGKPWKWTYTNDVTLYAQWKGVTAKICYHSEDEKHNITKTYQVGAGQKFETATDWWKKQKFTSAYEPGNSIFAGWTTKKGSTDDMYSENAAVPNKLITDNVNSTIDLYSIWDKPTVTITPTSNNVSFNCNNKTWYKDTIEFKLTGTDKRYNVIGFDFVLNGNKSGNWRTTNNGKSLTHTFSTSEFYTGGLRTVISKGNPFTVKVWSESSTATSGTPMGSSDALSTQYWIDFTAPDLTYSVDSSHNIKATATDGESGVDTIDLQSYRDGQWVSVKKVTASSSQYGQFVNTFNLNQSDYKYRYRIAATDHLGNSKTSNEFYVVPLTLSTSLSKLNGDAVYNGQTLEFIAGGDLNATVNVNITGYAEKVKYEFANELGQVTDTHVVSYDASGNTTETKQFLIPWEIEHNKNYYVKVTAYRGSESASTVEYVKLSDIDFSKFRSNILYQSGQHD